MPDIDAIRKIVDGSDKGDSKDLQTPQKLREQATDLLCGGDRARAAKEASDSVKPGAVARDDVAKAAGSPKDTTDGTRSANSEKTTPDGVKPGDGRSTEVSQSTLGIDNRVPPKMDFQPTVGHYELQPGESERVRQDGARCIYDQVVGADGKNVERMLRLEKPNGTISEYGYDKNDPTKLNCYKDTINTAYGKTIVSNSVREDASGTFKYTDSQGRQEKHLDTHIEDGRVKYRAGDYGSRVMDKLIGPSWLTVDALTEAKDHFVEVAGRRLFNKNPQALEHYVDRLIHHFQEPGKTGVKPMSDDKIAQFLAYAAKPLETDRAHRKNGAHALSDREIEKAEEQMLKTVMNPERNNNQGQIGSCYMNSIRYLAEKTQLNRIGQMFASMYTNGSLKGHRFDADDLRPLNNQDYYNHSMNTAFVKMAGVFNKLNGNYRGTTTQEAETAYKKLFGKEFPVFTLGQSIRQKDLDDAIAKFGGAACITLGGAHAQVVHKNEKGQYYLENWWNGYAGNEGVLSASQLRLRS